MVVTGELTYGYTHVRLKRSAELSSACFCSATNIALLQVLDGFFELETATAMADIYVWLRYSSTRQLTWQRNYNTQPRILSAAQVGNCLTTTWALAYTRQGSVQAPWGLQGHRGCQRLRCTDRSCG